MKKSLRNLIPEDFHVSPIWQPIDDLEDPDMEVIPFEGQFLHMEKIYLIACKFKLADGSEFEGYVRFSWGRPIAMALAINKNEFLLFAVGRLVETEERHLEFARKLNKRSEDVFPLGYGTSLKIYMQGEVY